VDATHYICTQPALAPGSELGVDRLGIHERQPPQVIYRPSGNLDYLLMHFHTPCMVRAAGDGPVEPANTFIVWPPGSSHCYGSADTWWDHSWLHVSGSVAERLVRGCGLRLGVPIQLPDSRLVDTYLPSIHAEISEQPLPDVVIIGNLLQNWLRELHRQTRQPRSSEIPPIFADVKGYIEAGFSQRLRLPDLAARTYLSVPQFCARFKRYFGFSAVDYAVRLRMQQAAFLLRDVNLRVKEVARDVGYDDIYYFSKLFKRHHGVSPRAYRARLIA
jgi:AraC family transcriptional regulator of arabinose operon